MGRKSENKGGIGDMFIKLFWVKHASKMQRYDEVNLNGEFEDEYETHDGMTQWIDLNANSIKSLEFDKHIEWIGNSLPYY